MKVHRQIAILGLMLGFLGSLPPENPFFMEIPDRKALFKIGEEDVAILRQPDGMIVARIYAINIGEKRAKTATFFCHLAREGKVLKEMEAKVERIRVGQKAEARCELGKLSPGLYDLRIRMRYNGKEANRRIQFTIGGPNLRVPVNFITIYPLSPQKNHPFHIRIGIVNNGTEPAPSVVSQLEIWKEGKKILGPITKVIPEILAGEHTGYLETIEGLPVGNYEIITRLDPENKIPEIYEQDNVERKALRILPDFAEVKLPW